MHYRVPYFSEEDSLSVGPPLGASLIFRPLRCEEGLNLNSWFVEAMVACKHQMGVEKGLQLNQEKVCHKAWKGALASRDLPHAHFRRLVGKQSSISAKVVD